MVRDLLLDHVIPLAPAVLLGITWIQVIRTNVADDAPFVRWLPHLIATSSELYYWIATLAPRQLVGPDYSDLRHYLIIANLLAALGIALIVCFWKIVARWWLFGASVFLALTWLLVAGVQAAV